MSQPCAIPAVAPASPEDNTLAFFNRAPVGYLTLHATGEIVEANRAFERMCGLPDGQGRRRPFRDMVAEHHHPVWDYYFPRLLNSDERESCTVALCSGQNGQRQALIDGIMDDEGIIALVTVTDITEPRKADAVHHRRDRLAAAGHMAGGLAHDFNNLLSVILLSLDVSRTMLPAHGNLDDLLQAADAAVKQAARLTSRLIAFADGGRPVLERSELNERFRECAALMLVDTSVALDDDLDPDLPPVMVDTALFEQVVRNLVTNACEAMPEGGRIALTSRRVSLALINETGLPPGDYVTCSIQDNGKGIPAGLLPRIFDPYFSTKPRDSRKGVGFGLAMCHAIMTSHRGAILVESDGRNGARVDLYFPVVHSPAQPPVGPA
jgi:signal transduction histidine kinase